MQFEACSAKRVRLRPDPARNEQLTLAGGVGLLRGCICLGTRLLCAAARLLGGGFRLLRLALGCARCPLELA